MIESKPVIPEQPNKALYPSTDLELFPRLTRATYQERYGVQPPTWDGARRRKAWLDTSALDGFQGDPNNEVVVYDVFDAASGTGTRRMALTVAEASTPNLPGKMVYPKYVVEPTPAVIVAPLTGERTGVNPTSLSHYADAVAIAAELGLTADAVREIAVGAFRIEWNGELRRSWVVVRNGENLQASLLLRARNINGVGAPGRWDLSAASPVWVADLPDTGEQDTRPEIPVPVRRLLPNEKVVPGFGGLQMIQRQDLVEPTEGDLLKILQRIETRVEAVARLFGI